MTKKEKVDFLIGCAEDLEEDHNLEIWGNGNLQEYADAFREGAEALRERKTGKWIHNVLEGGYYCSVCGNGRWIHGVHPRKWKACPWCTALMEVDE